MTHPRRVPVLITAALVAPVALQATTSPPDVSPMTRVVASDRASDNSRARADRARVFQAHERGSHQRSTEHPTLMCPMHPDVKATEPGSCPHCGMSLVPMDKAGDYQLDVETSPSPPTAGQPARVRLTVRDAETNEVVRDFAVVHEKRLHLFLLSQDLEHYEHLHPNQNDDGAWAFDVTLPRAAIYKLYADCRPEDGSPQVLSESMVTAGVAGKGEAARLVPDPVLTKSVGGMSVELELPPGGLVANHEATLTYRLTDARTGAAVTDLEPYLGAWGHTLILSEDMQQYVHAHPTEHVPDATARSGPELSFQARLPEPGRYRIWTQVKRSGEVSTAIFTVAVASPSEQ